MCDRADAISQQVRISEYAMTHDPSPEMAEIQERLVTMLSDHVISCQTCWGDSAVVE